MSLSSSGDTSATSCTIHIVRKKSTIECISSLKAKRAKQIVTLCKYDELAIWLQVAAGKTSVQKDMRGVVSVGLLEKN